MDINGIDNTGKTLVTRQLQELIDENDELVINKGIYLTGPLFLHKNFKLILNDAILLATIDEKEYHDIKTRVAGINMSWYPAIINVIDCDNVEISGNGIIDGNGGYWYKKYWGLDTKGGMRKEYDEKNIRFLCDYDCKRPRNILIQNSHNVTLDGLTSKDSGFWNIHILYSNNINVKNIIIKSDILYSPSTDGIDIDSSHDCIIENVISSTNDDSICIKSGRDYDGLKTNIPTHDIIIRNSKILKGFGITIGSELSGGIYNITIDNIEYDGTDCAFRIKSSERRKGYIKNIYINNLKCLNVKYLININLSWNPNYNKLMIPKNIDIIYKDYYDIIMKEVDDNISNTIIDDIYLNNIYSRNTNDYDGISRVFHIEGFDNPHIKNIYIDNMDVIANEYGLIKNIDNLDIKNSNIITKIDIDNKNDDYDNR